MHEVIEKILAAENICVFRHINPDGDAIFSQAAMIEFINSNFPDKKVYAGGHDRCDLLDIHDELSDELIKDSLVIVTDTATKERIDDERAISGRFVIKIDHHPAVDDYGSINLVSPSSSAACEYLGEMLLGFKDRYVISSRAAEYLLCGILTDTMSFMTTNTTSKTLFVASELLKIADKSLSDLHAQVFGEDLNQFMYQTELRNRLSIKGSCGYIIADQSMLNELDIDYKKAKSSVSLFNGIKEFKTWGIFAYNEDKGYFEASLRSKKEIAVNEVAARYNGGGHRNAAGIKELSLEDCLQIIDELAIL